MSQQISGRENAAALLDILKLTTLEENLFRGEHEAMTGARLFGGQVLAQALAAATNTVSPDRPCHSLHSYFLRPGNPARPVIYRVERIRDGRSFTTRRIVAIQQGEAIFSMDASFQVMETGYEHQVKMPEVPGPETLQDDVVLAKQRGTANPWQTRERPFECRTVAQEHSGTPRSSNPVWLRFRGDAPSNQAVQQQLLAYASDMGLVSTSYLPHAAKFERDQLQLASLDHALWFFDGLDVGEWMLYLKESTSAEAARGFNRGAFYNQEGRLLATSMQEGLVRGSFQAEM